VVSVHSDQRKLGKPLRLWPGVAFAVLVVVVRYVAPIFSPDALRYGIFVALGGTLAILMWWLFASRAAWWERLGFLALAIAGMAVTLRFLDVSVARGNMGFQYYLHGVPVVSVAFVVGAVAGRGLSNGLRRATMAGIILIACGAWTLVRSQGVTGDGMAQFTWRWTQTPEERLLAARDDNPGVLDIAAPMPAPEAPAAVAADAVESIPTEVPTPAIAADVAPMRGLATEATTDAVSETALETTLEAGGENAVAATRPSWPGLRGQGRDGVVRGLEIASDWSATPPVELWRREIGPGVSSFAVRGDLLYTQEQRGDDELVAAYSVETGEPVWRHRDAARFWDAHVGAGPRATPAVAGSNVYTLGATGILNALDAESGALVWSRDAAADTGAALPTWGFVSSPLVVGDLLVVQAATLIAYDLATGEPRWRGPEKRGSYSSPHLLEIDGVTQILIVGHSATMSVSPTDGTVLWEHPWRGVGIVQPVRIGDGDILISLIDAGAAPIGTRRVAVSNGGPAGWSTEERWTSNQLKTSFSDVVVDGAYAYGVDGRLLACVDLETGERRWKGGRYGEAQLLYLPDSGLLLVLTERGEIALVRASPDRFEELARIAAIDGKTWNQPALVGDVLLVRNGEEMAAFRLARAGE
jgi:outer membrane protein assembly factor BamB